MDIFEAAAVGNTSKLWHILEECPNDVDERNGLWQTPLIVACINNQYLAARLLIERGADILAQDRESGWTPLHHCMYRGYLAVGSLIVKARRDAWRRYSAPTTPKICQQHHPQGYNRRRGSSSTSNQRNHNKRLKRGMVAKSRHGFEYVLKSPLEIEDYEGKRPYDLVKPQKISHLDDENVESIATDLNGTFAVTSKGDCFSWGLGHGGRLGLNTYDDNDNSSHKKRYLGGGGQKQIEGSGTYQILPRKMLGFGNNKRLKMIGTHGELGGALTSSGSLYLWGTLHLPIHENTTTTAAAVTNINSKDNGSIIFNKGVSGFSSSSSCSIDGTPKKLHTYEKKINKFVFGSVPFKISSSVKFTSVSVCKSRVCLVAAQLSRVYILGRDIGEQKRAFNSPMHLKEFSNVKDAVASQDPGGSHALAVSNLGNVFACTSNNSSYGCVVNNDSPVTHGKAGKAKLVKSKRRHNKNRTVATLVPGLSRVFVVQAAIASKHAAIVSKDGDLYTWGKGCIGHGKQTKTLIPTRVHRLRQIAKVAVADGHTVAVQRLKVPLKLTHAKSALIYDDPFAMSRNRIFNNNDDDDYKEYSRRPSGGVVPLLQHLCEEALVESIGIISPTTLFKCFKMAFRLKLDRLVRFCARYIMLNHRHLVPLALKSLSKDELQQIDFFTFLWSTDPYMNLGETKRISMLSAKFPSYLHAEWLHQHLQQEERVLELTQTFYYDHLNSSGVGSSQYNNNNNNNNTCVNNTTTMTTGGGGGGGEGTTPRKSPVHGPSFGSELIELVTAKDGKKHARVLRRVKKRFRELRKKLKQIQSLKKKGIEDSGYNLTIEQRAKVDREKDYADEFDGLKKALRMHQAGQVQKLEAIQSKQLADELNRQEIEWKKQQVKDKKRRQNHCRRPNRKKKQEEKRIEGHRSKIGGGEKREVSNGRYHRGSNNRRSHTNNRTGRGGGRGERVGRKRWKMRNKNKASTTQNSAAAAAAAAAAATSDADLGKTAT
eukprot:jgi/Bigna1/130618/aug1.11_g5326